MKCIFNTLERLTSRKTEDDSEIETLAGDTTEDILNDVIRSFRRKFSLVESRSPLIRRKKEALRQLYSNNGSVGSGSSSPGRRYTVSLGVETSVKDFLTVRDAKKPRRSDGSIFYFAKDRIFSRARGSEGSVAGTVARKVETRKRELKHLSRDETIELMRTKYGLHKKRC